MKITRKITIALAVAVVLSLISAGAVIAIVPQYIFHTSNPDLGHVNPTPTPAPTATPAPTPITVNSGLVLSPKTIQVGETWTLTVTLSPAVAGITVNFYEGSSIESGVLVGSAVTTVSGIATLTLSPGVGDHIYIAQPQS